jgi:hypothetical protein
LKEFVFSNSPTLVPGIIYWLVVEWSFPDTGVGPTLRAQAATSQIGAWNIMAWGFKNFSWINNLTDPPYLGIILSTSAYPEMTSPCDMSITSTTNSAVPLLGLEFSAP